MGRASGHFTRCRQEARDDEGRSLGWPRECALAADVDRPALAPHFRGAFLFPLLPPSPILGRRRHRGPGRRRRVSRLSRLVSAKAGLALIPSEGGTAQTAGRPWISRMMSTMTAATRRRWIKAPRCQTENPRSQRMRRMIKTVHNMTFPLSFDHERARSVPNRA